MKVRTMLGLVTAFALALPTAAQAALPTAKSTLISPNHSLGGVKLGSSLAAATAAWGKGGTCSTSGCNYQSTNDRDGSASFLVSATTAGGPEVVLSISIDAGLLSLTGNPKHNFDTPLSRLKTSSGIGIGATVKQLHHAYPHLKNGGAPGVYTIPGTGEGFTVFEVIEGRVSGIQMQSVHLG
jgi:hypothetical protein